MIIFKDNYTKGIVDYFKKVDRASPIKRASFGGKTKYPLNYDVYYDEVIVPELEKEYEYGNE